MRGTVTAYRAGQGGKVRPEDGGKELDFRLPHGWLPGLLTAPAVLMQVEFELEGGRAIRVRPAGWSPQASRSGPREARAPLSTGRFFNPYNFVRPLPQPTPEGAVDAGVQLLGRAPPPPLDRYVGLSGRITCTLTTRSPVFVSDSHGVDPRTQPNGKVHKAYRFFRDAEGVPTIPASSLRGVVRSVFEAVTSSCWEHVADRTLSRRIGTELAALLVPGRLARDDGGEWWLEAYTGSTPWQPQGPVSVGEPLYAAWVPRYGYEGRPLAARTSGWDGTGKVQPYGDRGVPQVPGWLSHRKPCFARIRLTRHDRGNAFNFWNVEAIGGSAAEVARGALPTDHVVQGWYCETGFNIQHKHDERIFFNLAVQGKKPVAGERMRLTEAQVQRYLDLLEDYRENDRRKEGRGKGGKPGPRPSGFVRGGPKNLVEANGELVYALLEEGEDGLAVGELAPVSVPRLFYRRSIRALFPAAARPCTSENHGRGDRLRLCPACRVFGWVSASMAERHDERAYRSRVRLGDARFTAEGALDDSQERPLPILSAPKPTTVQFYLAPGTAATSAELRPVDDGRRARRDVRRPDYETPGMVVRGRKFYRRQHGTELRPPEENSDQNRTLQDWLRPDQEAEFDLHFECLAPVELGALLWSLGLPKGWTHRLGFGKPLGMGDVEIQVDGLLLHGMDRYAADPTPVEDASRWVEPLKKTFQAAMERRYGTRFGALANVSDLRALLRRPDAGGHPVEYPSLNDDSRPESFHWFVVNNGRSYDQRPRGKGVWLGFAADDPGLPHDPATP